MVKKRWQDLPEGCVIDKAATSKEFKTGDWRIRKPIFDPEKCIHCFICWIYCPDGSILIKNKKVIGIDYDYCKGCSLCAEVCPPRARAIRMEREEK